MEILHQCHTPPHEARDCIYILLSLFSYFVVLRTRIHRSQLKAIVCVTNLTQAQFILM